MKRDVKRRVSEQARGRGSPSVSLRQLASAVGQQAGLLWADPGIAALQ